MERKKGGWDKERKKTTVLSKFLKESIMKLLVFS